MAITATFHESLAAAENALGMGESLVQFRLAAPQMGRVDYLTRFKAYVGVLDLSNSTISSPRRFLVTKSSNTGAIAIDETTPVDSLPDVW